LPSKIITNTYFINDSSKLPIISISTTPANLWDNTIGIYVAGTNGKTGWCSDVPVNWNQDWERPANIEYFDLSKSQVLNANAGIKISGGCSRTAAQKSLAVIARNKYGTNSFQYQLFINKPSKEYKSFLVRNHGNDFGNAIMRDAVIQKTVCRKMNIDYQEYQPVLVYINGQYWGIQELREKVNEHYVSVNYNIPTDAVDILEQIYPNTIGDTYQAMHGEAKHFNSLVSFMSTNDLSITAYYEYIKNQIDIEEYINYQIAEIYVDNTDWPGNNVKIWRNRTGNGKYRWVMFDTDFGLGLYGRAVSDNSILAATSSTGPSWPNPPYSTLILRQLLKNQEFKTQFINSFIFHINTTFKPENFIRTTDSITNILLPEAARHHTRWNQNYSNWTNQINVIKTYAQGRPDYVLQHLSSYFSLGSAYEVSIENQNPDAGYLLINNISFNEKKYSGKHLSGVPLNIIAIPKTGFRFNGWYFNSNAITAIAKNDLWKYLDDGTNQDTSWRYPSYNDKSWKSGKAILGYGGNGETTILNYGSDSNNKYITYYFRKNFEVPDTSDITSITANISFDDGAVVYINGKQVASFNMPSGIITYTTLALSAIGGTDESKYTEFQIDKKYLVNGINLIAVELHQNYASSSDISFDLELNIKTNPEYVLYTNKESLSINQLNNKAYIAVFEKCLPVQINELNLFPSGGPNYAFIELYNQLSEQIDISGVTIEGNCNFTFPDNSIIEANEYFIVAADINNYKSIKSFRWDSARFDNSGYILLKDKNKKLIDSVHFDNKFPWPEISNPSDFSIEVSNHNKDNNDGTNWHISSIKNGTPGALNSLPDKPIIIKINEVVPSNSMYYGDENGNFPDLIEIYNASDIPVNIAGYIITDDTLLKKYFTIPDSVADLTTIPSKGFLVLWADKDTASGPLHTNFNINKTSEVIRLYDKNFNKIDEVIINNMINGQSLYRYPDGNDKIGITSYPTPGFKNIRLNSTPAFISTPPLYALVNMPYLYKIQVTDPDENENIIITAQLPTWLKLTDNGNGTAIISGTCISEGNFNIKITAVDKNKSQSVQSFTINVGKLNNIDNETFARQVKIIPNPGNGLFNVDFGNIINYANIEILDIYGRPLLSMIQTRTDSFTLDLTGFAKGIYILKIDFNETIINKIIIIN